MQIQTDTIKVYSTLYGVSSTGKIKEWTISVYKPDPKNSDMAIIKTKHGYVGQKITETEKNIYEGKNIGKANATTPYQQAVSEADSAYKQKLDKQYRTSIEELNQTTFEIELPMLAHSFDKREHDIIFPCFVQPKLNGVRCLSKRLKNEMRATSRGGKRFKAIQGLVNLITPFVDENFMTDGEIYCHDLTFQEIITAIKNEEDFDKNLDNLEYWIYDIPSSIDFKHRINMMASIIQLINHPRIKLVPTRQCNNREEIMEAHRGFMTEGYEGTMIRNMKGGYEFKNRSKNLQKYKDFVDGEFEIIGGEEGTGLSEGQCVFKCKTPEGKEFGVRCVGTNAVREEQWNNLDSYIGKWLTVKYQNLSDDGIPIFPVGISVRDYE